MLSMRPNCECCNRDLLPDQHGAMICSFECTFCMECSETKLHGRCPNCGGDLMPRPTRAMEKLVKYPTSNERVLKAGGCG